MPVCSTHQHAYVHVCTQCVIETQQRALQHKQPPMPQGYYSNQRITQRNGGVRPLFVNDIGGCSENYR